MNNTKQGNNNDDDRLSELLPQQKTGSLLLWWQTSVWAAVCSNMRVWLICWAAGWRYSILSPQCAQRLETVCSPCLYKAQKYTAAEDVCDLLQSLKLTKHSFLHFKSRLAMCKWKQFDFAANRLRSRVWNSLCVFLLLFFSQLLSPVSSPRPRFPPSPLNSELLLQLTNVWGLFKQRFPFQTRHLSLGVNNHAERYLSQQRTVYNRSPPTPRDAWVSCSSSRD